MDTRYGACERCKTLGRLRHIGTLDPQSYKPKTLWLCPTCEPLFLHMSRKDRRDHERGLKRLAKHGPRKGPRGRVQLPPRNRPKPSPIIVPEKMPSPIILPGQERSA